jgi:cysteine sulfinate desulfinase/cysteine desulfurase-like protein
MTNPTPSQSARDAAADVALQIYGARVSDGIRSGAIKYHHLIDATHAAEQRGMEKAADEVERLRAENASLRAEIERLISQTVAVPRLDR